MTKRDRREVTQKCTLLAILSNWNYWIPRKFTFLCRFSPITLLCYEGSTSKIRVNLNASVLQEIGRRVPLLVVVNKFEEYCASVVLDDISATQLVGARNLTVKEIVEKNVHLNGISAIGDRYAF